MDAARASVHASLPRSKTRAPIRAAGWSWAASFEPEVSEGRREAALNASVGQGRFASASRADYAGAAVTVPRSIEAGPPLLHAC
ncbi:hypothetical protein F6X40_04410 [Paraburkholderia sp. UCT31]|nr:hypothetical protein [Paraburkholderia sp. UCT31]